MIPKDLEDLIESNDPSMKEEEDNSNEELVKPWADLETMQQ